MMAARALAQRRAALRQLEPAAAVRQRRLSAVSAGRVRQHMLYAGDLLGSGQGRLQESAVDEQRLT